MRGALALCLTACGYHLVQGQQVFGSERIRVGDFSEGAPLGLRSEFEPELRRALLQGGMAVVEDPGVATLRGTISAVTSPSPTRSRVASYRLEATVRARLEDPAGRILWKDVVTLREEYRVDDQGDLLDGVGTDKERHLALQRMATAAAVQIRRRLLLAAAR
jgi:outer membrane lipopolysaccharide assembly protein LptE/RlpB